MSKSARKTTALLATWIVLTGCVPSVDVLSGKAATASKPDDLGGVTVCQTMFIDIDNDGTTGAHFWLQGVEQTWFGIDIVVPLDGIPRDWETWGILPATVTVSTDPDAPNNAQFNTSWCDSECTPGSCIGITWGYMAVDVTCDGDPYDAWPDIWMSGLQVIELEYVAEWANCFSRQE